ncbi:MAG: protein kinase domain-containing protein [Chitinispirillaceae bacterium]
MSSSEEMGQNQKDTAKFSENKRQHVTLPLAPDQNDSDKPLDKKTTLGSGTVTQRINVGGMAIIYEIWNQELEITRAVKLLRPDHTEDSVERFQTEMKISAKLHHPNIIEIYTVGKWHDLPYIEMERIDGFTLEKIIEQAGCLPLEVCTAVAIMIGRALNYAHNQIYVLYGKTYKGIIHRDLKPSNVMITNNGKIKLMDFGIAKPVTASIHTCTDVVIGTLQYLSPEQLEGRESDCRSDIYSLGAVIYEMLTGRQAFPEPGLARLVPDKLEGAYVPLDKYDIKIPRTLRDIVHKSLRREPEKRYQSTLEFLRAIGRVHKKLTRSSPEQVMDAYMQKPRIRKEIELRKASPLLKPLLIGGAAAALLLASTLTTLYLIKPGKFNTFNKMTRHMPADHYRRAKKIITHYAKGLHLRKSNSTSPTLKPVKSRQSRISENQKRVDVRDHLSAMPPGTYDKPKRRGGFSSMVDSLRFEYQIDDLAEIFFAEFDHRRYDNALRVFEKLPQTYAKLDKVQIYRLRALINSGNIKQSEEVLRSQQLNDGEFLVEKAMYYYRAGRLEKAEEMLMLASEAPVGFMNRTIFQRRLLFTKAICKTKIFENNPTEENRDESLRSWQEVKKALNNTPDHGYYTEADKQIRRIAQM